MYRKIILLIPVILFLSLGALFYSFIKDVRVYRFSEKTVDVDAIVALSGGLGRIEEGLNLLLKNKGRYLIISGVDKGSDVDSIFFLNNPGDLVDKGRIILEKSSTSTYENAREVKKIIDRKGFKSIILITSAYHMKRAGFTFLKVLPGEVEIYFHTVSTENFNEKEWWNDGNSILILFSEFVKFYWYFLSY